MRLHCRTLPHRARRTDCGWHSHHGHRSCIAVRYQGIHPQSAEHEYNAGPYQGRSNQAQHEPQDCAGRTQPDRRMLHPRQLMCHGDEMQGLLRMSKTTGSTRSARPSQMLSPFLAIGCVSKPSPETGSSSRLLPNRFIVRETCEIIVRCVGVQ